MLTVNVTNPGPTFKGILEETLSAKARSATIADRVRGLIKEADEVNRKAFGQVPPKKVTVDGREDPQLTSVPPDHGTIVAHYYLVQEVLAWIMNTLTERSPVRSGAYRHGHKLFADGVEIDPDETNVFAKRYVFLNTVPYARRLEIGKTKTDRAFVLQVENQIYKRTAADAKDRFGNIVNIKYGFDTAPGSVALKRVRRFRRRRRRAGEIIKSPSITLTVG